MERFKILVVITLLLSACSNDDTDTPAVDEFGTIKAVVTITGGVQDFSIDFVTTTSPASSRITYENTGDKYETGPDQVEQNQDVHTFTTTSDASNLNIGFLPTASDVNEEKDISYKIEIFFNGSKHIEESYSKTIGKISHSFLWSTKTGLNEQLIDPF